MMVRFVCRRLTKVYYDMNRFLARQDENESGPSAPTGSPTSLRLFQRDLVSKASPPELFFLFTLARRLATSSSALDMHSSTCGSAQSIYFLPYSVNCPCFSVNSRRTLFIEIIPAGIVSAFIPPHHGHRLPPCSR